MTGSLFWTTVVGHVVDGVVSIVTAIVAALAYRHAKHAHLLLNGQESANGEDG